MIVREINDTIKEERSTQILRYLIQIPTLYYSLF